MRVAIVTPSWAPDYELCRILVESVRRYLPEDIPHYLLVAREDLVLFQSLASERTIVLRTDAAIGGFYRVPFSRKWRVALDALPVRGWIHQQLLKLSLADLLDADVYVLVDSDCFYVRPFDPRSVFIDGKVPLAREEKEWFANDPETQHWHRIAAKLLGLPLTA